MDEGFQCFPGILLEVSSLSLTLESLILCFLLLASALISGSEVAFFSLPNNVIEQCRRSKNRNQVLLARVLDQPKVLLATILILNNLVNVAIVTISSYLTWQIFGKDEQGLIIVALTTSTTAAIVFFGEVVPKVFAQQRSMAFALLTIRPLVLFIGLFRPLSWVLINFGDLIEKQLSKKQRTPLSVEHINQALELTKEPDASSEAQKIIRGVVNFGRITVKQIMRSRLDITAFDTGIAYHSLLQKIDENGYSRLPVYDGTLDKIIGLLYAKDLLPYLNESPDFDWKQVIRKDVFFVPENKKIDDLFRDFQQKHIHMAIIVDEYGGTLGLVTLEDILEEIVGEINDEFDFEEERLFEKKDEQTYVFLGKITLIDFCKEFDIDESIFEEAKGESESLGGLLLELFGNIPKPGEHFRFKNFLFTVETVDRKRIKKVRVELQENTSENE